MGRPQQHQWKLPDTWEVDNEYVFDDKVEDIQSPITPKHEWDEVMDEFLDDYDEFDDIDIPNLDDDL